LDESEEDNQPLISEGGHDEEQMEVVEEDIASNE